MEISEWSDSGSLLSATTYEDLILLKNEVWIPSITNFFRATDSKARRFEIIQIDVEKNLPDADFVLKFDEKYAVADQPNNIIRKGIDKYSFREKKSAANTIPVNFKDRLTNPPLIPQLPTERVGSWMDPLTLAIGLGFVLLIVVIVWKLREAKWAGKKTDSL